MYTSIHPSIRTYVRTYVHIFTHTSNTYMYIHSHIHMYTYIHQKWSYWSGFTSTEEYRRAAKVGFEGFNYNAVSWGGSHLCVMPWHRYADFFISIFFFLKRYNYKSNVWANWHRWSQAMIDVTQRKHKEKPVALIYCVFGVVVSTRSHNWVFDIWCLVRKSEEMMHL